MKQLFISLALSIPLFVLGISQTSDSTNYHYMKESPSTNFNTLLVFLLVMSILLNLFLIRKEKK